MAEGAFSSCTIAANGRTYTVLFSQPEGSTWTANFIPDTTPNFVLNADPNDRIGKATQTITVDGTDLKITGSTMRYIYSDDTITLDVDAEWITDSLGNTTALCDGAAVTNDSTVEVEPPADGGRIYSATVGADGKTVTFVFNRPGIGNLLFNVGGFWHGGAFGSTYIDDLMAAFVASGLMHDTYELFSDDQGTSANNYAALATEAGCTVLPWLSTVYTLVDCAALEDMDNWDIVAARLEEIRGWFPNVPEIGIEIETAIDGYWAGTETLDLEAFQNGLKRLPKNLRYVWYPAIRGNATNVWPSYTAGTPMARFVPLIQAIVEELGERVRFLDSSLGYGRLRYAETWEVAARSAMTALADGVTGNTPYPLLYTGDTVSNDRYRNKELAFALKYVRDTALFGDSARVLFFPVSSSEQYEEHIAALANDYTGDITEHDTERPTFSGGQAVAAVGTPSVDGNGRMTVAVTLDKTIYSTEQNETVSGAASWLTVANDTYTEEYTSFPLTNNSEQKLVLSGSRGTVAATGKPSRSNPGIVVVPGGIVL